ncbi:homoserine dehydrogenase-like protein [Pseudovirgaria hyperparasitica]|uniref:Homoserine dehydrogenase n=1 Tax=Pseudovirgaria hyperparasitica TaxID=470096 RepID=A0A6A6WE47_9PEZI|nr:homoserine dehydrogenase-like protein [Pseudovirgaria hyperparasitica]KAF2760993.1 homoserine dehydrogenase-like protein [Pseudovirgaria hyperparasitica]
MPGPRQIFIAVIGAGGVGKCFLTQLKTLASRLSQSHAAPTYFSLVLLSTSKKLIYSPTYQPLSLSTWEEQLQTSSTSAKSPADVLEFLAKADEPVVLIDNTSNQEWADSYPSFLKQGISIVTPNKKAFSSSYALWKDIYASARNGDGKGGWIYHESSVGAGLPVISTLKELVETGDEVRKIEGVFSGTMSFLFNSFMPVGGGGGSFSAEVKKAKDLGYTEPDPRDDLNGLDVARKLTILARLAGLPVESPTSFPVQSLIPTALESCKTGDEFMQKLGEYDGEMEKLKKEAAAEGKVVRFVGSIDVGKKEEADDTLTRFDASHPIAALKGSDNIISFYTARYGENPLIIQGAGAGGDVTAMGVTGDLIKCLRLMHS